ncbi:Putative germin-like protein 2-1 [Apostasia shenzhenica]|uniref:Germin-like protein n=1 Tax=Apostasia shenzhenica TaxID=1088818 RepID=A0A2I0A9P9_9ASPA|nr:Putative germin-like protein 2-1 [Apostasia shenzhenica]
MKLASDHLPHSKRDQLMPSQVLRLLALLAFAASTAMATDPTQLQDFCVTDTKSKVFVNGFVCKNPNDVTENDFFFSGLNITGNTANQLGSKITSVNALNLPGLNTLGISLIRIDFAAGGFNPPHTHPRATEILVVLEGTLAVGFVTSDPDNKLFAKVLNPGDVFVFPQGLVHFQINIGMGNAVAFAGFSSQRPRAIIVANAVFGSKAPISDDVLMKAFQLDKPTVDSLKAKFWADNN